MPKAVTAARKAKMIATGQIKVDKPTPKKEYRGTVKSRAIQACGDVCMDCGCPNLISEDNPRRNEFFEFKCLSEEAKALTKTAVFNRVLSGLNDVVMLCPTCRKVRDLEMI